MADGKTTIYVTPRSTSWHRDRRCTALKAPDKVERKRVPVDEATTIATIPTGIRKPRRIAACARCAAPVDAA